MVSKTNAALAPNATTGSGGDFKITFYSTSPKEDSKSKYPMQTKTSYMVPDSGGGETEINFGKPLAASSRPKTRVIGFRSESRKRDTPEIDSKKESKISQKQQALETFDTTSPSPLETTRSGRVSKKPQRYEPIETVTDDFNDDDYDTDDSFEN
jgi:hypothetical protein